MYEYQSISTLLSLFSEKGRTDKGVILKILREKIQALRNTDKNNRDWSNTSGLKVYHRIRQEYGYVSKPQRLSEDGELISVSFNGHTVPTNVFTEDIDPVLEQ